MEIKIDLYTVGKDSRVDIIVSIPESKEKFGRSWGISDPSGYADVTGRYLETLEVVKMSMGSIQKDLQKFMEDRNAKMACKA